MEKDQVTIKNIFRTFKEGLNGIYNQDEAAQFASILFEEWLGWHRLDIHLQGEKPLEAKIVKRFLAALEQLKSHKPIQYIIGVTHFLDAVIKVKPGVLIPRPETEELVSIIIQDYQHRRYEELSVLDIGTGSGCIPVAMKKEFPAFDITATDVSMEALNIARDNSETNNSRINLVLNDILDRELWRNFPSYSLIVSNPPYVLESEQSQMQRNVLDFEPHEALFVPDQEPLKFYKAIGEFAITHLQRPGCLYLEINEKFGPNVKELLIMTGFDKTDIMKDIHNKDRFVRAEVKTSFLDTSYWHVEH